VTIAASGQGRWAEEIQFPEDARSSGYTPVLVVLDPTPNPKLTELSREFKAQKAGATMARFLDHYVRLPLQSLLREVPEQLPDLLLQAASGSIMITVGSEKLTINRAPKAALASEADELPPDADNQIPTL
jgi:hypothetical protein